MNAPGLGYIFGPARDGFSALLETLSILREEGWLPQEQSWWCAWNETEIVLPQRLRDPATLRDGWDELRVFSAQVEFRQTRQGSGWRPILLAETDRLPPRLTGWHLMGAPYRVASSLRILWGRRLRMPGGEARGEVLFPRPLEYDVAEEAARYDHAVVADVRLYYDAEARLQTARYAGLRYLPPGAHAAQVRPLPCLRPEGG